jgi:hypothetical protein
MVANCQLLFRDLPKAGNLGQYIWSLFSFLSVAASLSSIETKAVASFSNLFYLTEKNFGAFIPGILPCKKPTTLFVRCCIFQKSFFDRIDPALNASRNAYILSVPVKLLKI